MMPTHSSLAPYFFGLFGLLWGSFLNVCAYRLLHDETPWYPVRSYCPTCKTTLRWFDLLPILSYITLRRRCRYCKTTISPLYPAIELTTAAIFFFYSYLIPPTYLLTSLLIATALIITIRTDFEEKVILRIASILIIPIIFLASYTKYLPINLSESLFTSVSVYIFFACIRAAGSWYAGQEALGLGDVELATFMASYSGFFGIWITIIIASSLGLIHGLIAICKYKKSHHLIPLGAYLAIASLFTLPILLLKNLYLK